MDRQEQVYFLQWKENQERLFGKSYFISQNWEPSQSSLALSSDLQELDVAPQAESDQLESSLVTSEASLGDIQKELQNCKRCLLSNGRQNIVFGEGDPHAELMFVGEGPGEQEDIQGRPFVGKAGQLLDKIIQAMGFDRTQVYIANIVKCRPPGNRTPEPDEILTCSPFLLRQIQIVRPKVLVALGSTAVRGLIQTDVKITRMRGQWLKFSNIPLMPTFHPSYLLRNPEAKKDVWEDMKKVMQHLRSAKA